MPGDNCSIYGCTVSRRAKYNGISLLKVPCGDGEFETSWRNKLVVIITKDRVIDSSLKKQIESKRLFICQRHFTEDCYHARDNKRTLVRAAIPAENLPEKSIPTTTVTLRESAAIKQQKRALHVVDPAECYKSFSEFSSRVLNLKLTGWQMTKTNNQFALTMADDIHMVPKCEIYVDENLTFKIPVLLWGVPSSQQLYSMNQSSVKNITISQLINAVKSFNICPGLSDQFISGCTEHSIPKLFLVHSTTPSYPLHQSKWYRVPSCMMLINNCNKICSACIAIESKETSSLKRKRINLNLPAEPKAPISFTSPERVKLTLQNYRLENKQLKEEINNLCQEIHSKSLAVDRNLGDDLVKIMSGADQKSAPPPIYAVVLGRAAKIPLLK